MSSIDVQRPTTEGLLDRVEKVRPILDRNRADSTAFQISAGRLWRSRAAGDVAVAKTAMLWDATWLQMLRAAHDIVAHARNGFLPFVDRARAHADAGCSTTCPRQAVHILLPAHGAGSFAEVNPLQRTWRGAPVGLPAEENSIPLI